MVQLVPNSGMDYLKCAALPSSSRRASYPRRSRPKAQASPLAARRGGSHWYSNLALSQVVPELGWLRSYARPGSMTRRRRGASSSAADRLPIRRESALGGRRPDGPVGVPLRPKWTHAAFLVGLGVRL